jgi:hypothetical protein
VQDKGAHQNEGEENDSAQSHLTVDRNRTFMVK